MYCWVVCQPPLAHESAFLDGVCSCLAATWAWHSSPLVTARTPHDLSVQYYIGAFLSDAHNQVFSLVRSLARSRGPLAAFSVSCDGGRRCVKNVKGAIKWLILTVDKLINGIPLSQSLGRRSCYCRRAQMYNSHDAAAKNSPERDVLCCAPYLRPRTSARKKQTDITPLPKERGN